MISRMRNHRDFGKKIIITGIIDKIQNTQTLLIRCELKLKPHENAARVYLTWILLQMKMNSDLKKKTEQGSARGDFILPSPPPTPPTPC